MCRFVSPFNSFKSLSRTWTSFHSKFIRFWSKSNQITCKYFVSGTSILLKLINIHTFKSNLTFTLFVNYFYEYNVYFTGIQFETHTAWIFRFATADCKFFYSKLVMGMCVSITSAFKTYNKVSLYLTQSVYNLPRKYRSNYFLLYEIIQYLSFVLFYSQLVRRLKAFVNVALFLCSESPHFSTHFQIPSPTIKPVAFYE